MRIAIVGYGPVGRALANVFCRSNEVIIFDKYIPGLNNTPRAEVNSSDLVFVCVPTPARRDGSCDTSEIEECASWITSPMCVKSTVIPGTVDRLARDFRRLVAFSPEYIGESTDHPWKTADSCEFAIVGGTHDIRELVIAAYQTCFGPRTRYYRTDARTAELCKYMENCFLATKVAFVNQFFDIASAFNVDFNKLRELWLADPRVGVSHTLVSETRGYGGRCLPKDVSAIISAMTAFGGAPLLAAVARFNSEVRKSDREASRDVTDSS